jgi:23S rRNA pseudouridine2605 synthase
MTQNWGWGIKKPPQCGGLAYRWGQKPRALRLPGLANTKDRCPGMSAACLAGGDVSHGRSLLPNQTGGIVLGQLSSVNRVIIPSMEERVQKILARAGLGSRRACEALIAAGRVRVNGQAVELGSKADPDTDTITVDGRKVMASEALAYIAVHKPRGVLSAVEAPDPRLTIRSLVPLPGTLYPVGRLDAESEGLILLTNDGELANRLTHPRYGHEKEYRVLVARRPDTEQIEALRHGVVLQDGHRTLPATAYFESSFGKGAWLRITLREGRKRQIREMCTLVGLPVVRIVRIRIGTLLLGNLKPREWRPLTDKEVVELKGKSGVHKPGKKPLTRQRN